MHFQSDNTNQQGVVDVVKLTCSNPDFKFNWSQTRLDHMSLIK